MILLDGGMGTMLQHLNTGRWPELLNFTAEADIERIHRRYIEAGSAVIYANTFGASAHKLTGSGKTPAEVVKQAVAIARRAAAGTDVKVALDVGPLGLTVEPFGDLPFDEAYAMFREQVLAGAGADIIAIETMTDLNEARAALLAAKEHSNLPVFVTMSFEKDLRTYTGCTVASMCLTLGGMGADALGFNCSVGPDLMPAFVEEAAKWTDLPLIVKPNAGLPDPETGLYSLSAAEFAAEMKKLPALGVCYWGGCCGTTPDFIAALKALDAPAAVRTPAWYGGLCSASRPVRLNGIRVVGERINPTGKKKLQQAIREGDYGYIQAQGVEQADAGADILDVNVGLPGCDEVSVMRNSVLALQKVVDLPLQIDSTNPAVIEAGLRVFAGKAVVNSVNGEKASLEDILPLVRKYGAAVVGLCMDEEGIPQTAEKRFEIAQRILNAALSYGIAREDVFIDCLTLTASAQQDQAVETLKAVRMVTQDLGLHTLLGVSNISFGLPARERITTSFLTAAMSCGLDLPIINPNQTAVMDAVAAYKVLSGEDGNCRGYIERFAADAPEAPKAAEKPTVEAAIAKGLGSLAAELTRELLQSMDGLTVVDKHLIPALDKVGENYEKGKIFLPQLVSAAGAACEAFAVVRQSVSAGKKSEGRGKIVIATVKGDIHDIGKNIVKTVLENYGYDVIDLGVDAAPEAVLQAAAAEKAGLVGLSAMMTTTVGAMEETIRLIRENGHSCAIMVGGAVLTAAYAEKIGADYYAADAKQSVDIAKSVFG